MKKGDTYPVKLNEYDIAEATVVEVDGDEVILEVPATRIVMGVKTALGDLERTPAVEQDMTHLPEGGGGSDASDDAARQALIAAGVELDEDDDLYTPRVETSGSLKDMKLNDDV